MDARPSLASSSCASPSSSWCVSTGTASQPRRPAARFLTSAHLLSVLQPFPTAQENSSGLGLIRACNALLSRLSKAEDAALRGRVLGFMASAFSLSARSGVNLRGEFNTGNTTTFEVASEPEEGDRVMDGVVEEPTAAEPSQVKEEKEEGEEEEDEESEEKSADAGQSASA